MSDHWIRFVPSDPNAQPTREAADRAVALLASWAPNADAVSAAFHEQVEFFDPGSNLESIRCPACGADAYPWWSGAMNDAYVRSAFTDLDVTAPCCGATVSLNDLRYDWPAAFGRFLLEAMNANIGETTPEQDRALADCLGLKLTKVLVRI